MPFTPKTGACTEATSEFTAIKLQEACYPFLDETRTVTSIADSVSDEWFYNAGKGAAHAGEIRLKPIRESDGKILLVIEHVTSGKAIRVRIDSDSKQVVAVSN